MASTSNRQSSGSRRGFLGALAELASDGAKMYCPLQELRAGSGGFLLTCPEHDGTYIEVSGPAKA